MNTICFKISTYDIANIEKFIEKPNNEIILARQAMNMFIEDVTDWMGRFQDPPITNYYYYY